MELQRGDRGQEERRRKTLQEVLEECQKALESLSAVIVDDDDDAGDDDDDYLTAGCEGENHPGSSSSLNSVDKECNQLSNRGRKLFDDKTTQVLVLKCEICEIKCSNLQKLEQHKSGKRHKKKVQLLEKAEQSEKGSAASAIVFSCEICKIECLRSQSLKQHISGKHHKKKLHSLKQHIG